MRFRARFTVSGLLVLCWACSLCGAPRIGAHFWPTPNEAFVDGRPLSQLLQPTQSGRLESALWGCVREGGSRFHEGIDLKAIQKDSRGEALDSIFAFDSGTVQYVNRDPSKSSYGRYIVVEHGQWMPGMVTLYAHLASIPNHIRSGVSVDGGQILGRMGRSASYAIPRERAHLHFEIGLWLGPRFQPWYDAQRFKTPNDHGLYNGMNILGFDVWEILNGLKAGKYRNVREYFDAMPVALWVTYWDEGIPDLLQVCPELMVNPVIPNDHAGWRIAFSSSGAPIRFQALGSLDRAGSRRTSIHVVDDRLARSSPCMSLVQSGGASAKLNATLLRLFVD